MLRHYTRAACLLTILLIGCAPQQDTRTYLASYLRTQENARQTAQADATVTHGAELSAIIKAQLPADAKDIADAAIAAQLRDPNSRQLKYARSFGGVVCGTVNAKNGFGGYGGPEPFYVLFSQGIAKNTKIFDHELYADAIIDRSGDMYIDHEILSRCGLI